MTIPKSVLQKSVLQNHGYRAHDEQKVDEFANALHALIVDNPEMFERSRL